MNDGQPSEAPSMTVPCLDTHAHIGWKRFDEDRDEVLQRARAKGVLGIVDVGIDLESSTAALERCGEATLERPALFPTAGLHPCDCKDHDSLWADIEDLILEDRTVAIGETGLDLYWKDVPLAVQRASLDKHLDRSRSSGKPVILHCRDAFEELFEQVEAHAPIHGILHCFTGSVAEAERCLELGLHVSFAGPVSYPKNSALREAAGRVPQDRILIETDAPFLPPQGWRGKRNEPSYVVRTAEVVAAARDIHPDRLRQQTFQNSVRLFSLDVEAFGLGGETHEGSD